MMRSMPCRLGLLRLLAGPDILTAILTYHVLGESLFTVRFLKRPPSTTLNGETISAEATDAGIVLNDTALIIIENIDASNGIIQAIDAVLFRPQVEKRAERKVEQRVERGCRVDGACGGASDAGGCFCDELCDQFGDCCEEVYIVRDLSFCQPPVECLDNSIMSDFIAQGNVNLTTLVTALETAGLDETFCAAGDYTVLHRPTRHSRPWTSQFLNSLRTKTFLGSAPKPMLAAHRMRCPLRCTIHYAIE